MLVLTENIGSGSQVCGAEDPVCVLMVEKIQQIFLRYLYMRVRFLSMAVSDNIFVGNAGYLQP